jgi:rubrerythrin
MNQNEVKKYLETLTNKQLVELLAEVLQKRRCDNGSEGDYTQAHWCLAEASRIQTEDGKGWENWEVGLLALHDSREYEGGWSDDSLMCQSGECRECGVKLIGWAKHLVCPVCGAKAYAT